jgi:hypothetical protein
VLDYWLWRRQVRLNHAATFWTATFFALPGILAAWYVYPVLLSTVDGFALFWHGAGAGAGLGAGLAFALRGFSSEARAEWFGFVLCLLLTGGAVAIHLNARQPEAEPTLVASPLIDQTRSLGHFRGTPEHDWPGERAVRKLGLRSVMVNWQGRPVRIVVDRDLVLRGDSVLLLSVYEGRFGFSVIERVHAAD